MTMYVNTYGPTPTYNQALQSPYNRVWTMDPNALVVANQLRNMASEPGSQAFSTGRLIEEVTGQYKLAHGPPNNYCQAPGSEMDGLFYTVPPVAYTLTRKDYKATAMDDDTAFAHREFVSDPHIKVAGRPEDVKLAKDNIMAVLDTKSCRVTLKMDVSHTEHSHVIGKGGSNIQRVMRDTDCHIHFPDSNRGNNGEKSNQVSIAGQPTGVESARSQIRDLLPLVFLFDIPVTGLLQTLPDSSSPAVQNIQQTYNVTVTFKQKPRVYVTTVIVRGTVNNAKNVKEATARIMEHVAGNMGIVMSVSMQLEIAPQHHNNMIGPSGVHMKRIMQATGATIHFPDQKTVQPQRKGTVYITGPIDSVYEARQQLTGYLPLVLMFDMKDEIEVDQNYLSRVKEQLDVYISIKAKPKQPSKSVIVKSVERNAASMYEARRLLLRLESGVPANNIAAIHDNSLHLAGLGTIPTHNLLSVNTANSMMYTTSLYNGHVTRTNSTNSPTDTNSSAGNNSPTWLTSPTGMYPPLVLMNHTTPYTTAQHTYQYGQCNGFTKDLNHNTRLDPAMDKGPGSHQSSSSGSPPCNSPTDLTLTRQNGQHDFSVAEVQNHRNFPPPTHQPPPGLPLATNNVTGSSVFGNVSLGTHISPSNSGSGTDLMGMRNVPGSPLNSTHASQITSLQESLRLMGLPGDRIVDRSSESSADSDGSDKKAPGSDRPSPNNSGYFTPYSFDYEKKKLQATKAMQKKPFGESRTPTDCWSGFGFSKSMPDHGAIRDRLQRNNERYTGPTMATMHETQDDEQFAESSPPTINCDPWRDGPSQLGMPVSGRLPMDYANSRQTRVKDSSPPPPPGLGPKPTNQALSPPTQTVNHRETSSSWPPKTDLAELFSTMSLGKYTDLFQQQEIDLQTFLTLTDQDLKELGITTFGARRKMLLAIADLNKQTPFGSATITGSNNPFHSSGASLGRRHDIASQSGRW